MKAYRIFFIVIWCLAVFASLARLLGFLCPSKITTDLQIVVVIICIVGSFINEFGKNKKRQLERIREIVIVLVIIASASYIIEGEYIIGGLIGITLFQLSDLINYFWQRRNWRKE
ncbi:MAG: hypothetical protein PHW31_01775 [Candidatus Pacebacteria bacterium]|nr:hypothetical protein [Candidatus Paceibacterota bacterium]